VFNRRERMPFLCILFMARAIILTIFGLVIASVFQQSPGTTIPCLIQIPLAVVIGAWLHRKGVSLVGPSVTSLAVMYFTVIFGSSDPLGEFNITPTG